MTADSESENEEGPFKEITEQAKRQPQRIPAKNEQLVSPAILKLHVFSTATSEKAYRKRQLIRELSPLNQLPPEYRHLVELKFVLGYHMLNDGWGPVNETAEAALQEEQAQHGDLFRMEDLWRGENLRDGKILQWIRDVGLGRDSPRQAWYLFKLDDDVSLIMPIARMSCSSRRPW